MKKIIFLFLFSVVAFFSTAQNYLFEITPQDSLFRVLITDDTREAYPRDVTDFGLVDTATLQLLAYQRIEQAKAKEADLQGRAFHAQLNAAQTATAIGAIVSIDYGAWAKAQFATAYEGNYKYYPRDGTSINAYILGYELRRKSNNNVLMTLVPQAANYLIATTTGASPVTFNLYQSGNFWVGKKPNGTIVTLKRN